MLDYHRELLADPVRTEAYREALRRTVRPGDVVVDIGSGTGILAYFACQAGARRVYAIEQEPVGDVIELLARQFGLPVTLIRGRSKDVELPEPADVLVTELLGTLGLDERILSTTIDARRRMLRPGAATVPRRIVLWLVPVEAAAVHAERVGWWGEPRYGLDFSPLRFFASNAIYGATIDPAMNLAHAEDFVSIDLATIEEPNIAGRAAFDVERDGIVHGFGGWFTAELAPDVRLSNAIPNATCWYQTFLPLEHPIEVAKGTPIEVELESQDGAAWAWRGRVACVEFHQSTRLGR